MLWVAIRLPYLQVDTLNNEQVIDPHSQVPEPSIAIYNNSKRIIQASSNALEQGVAEGMSMATARALCEKIQLLPERIDAPLDALRSLQLFSYRISPHSTIEAPDSLFIEISSTLKVFDGLDSILAIITKELAKRRWRHHVSVGLTMRAAALFSHCAQPPFLTPPSVPTQKQQQRAINQLAINQLQCSSKTILSLSKIGIEYCDQINKLTADDRKRTLSEDFNQYWQSLIPSGNQTRPTFTPPSQFQERVEFLNTINSANGLLFVCNRLAQNLGHYLIAIQGHTCELLWQLHDIEGNSLDIHIATAQPLQQYQPIVELTRLKLEPIKLKQPIDALTLVCDQITYDQQNQQDLFSRNDQHTPAHLLNLLAARLHEQAFFSLDIQPQHQPELAQTAVKAGSTESVQANEIALPPRPTFLLHNPPPLKMIGNQLCWRSPIKLLKGPERIETGWWFIPINRDYYVGQDQEHRLLWIFFDRLKENWFLAGVFS